VAQLRFDEDSARDVLLVRAIEAEDQQAAVLTGEDRHYADAAASRSIAISDAADVRQTVAFLSSRARFALERLVRRYPLLQQARTTGRWPIWLSAGVPIGALFLGLASNRINGDRFNILAFPLLGMLAWNLAVYLLLIVRALLRGAGDPDPVQSRGLIERLLRPAAAQLASHPTLERATVRFGRDWVVAAGPITRARVRRMLHLAAALFAIGVVVGIFVRARYTAEYSAGWSGTWAGAENEVAAFLSVVLAPASVLTGIALPTAERLRELRGAAENAGDWLILWFVTAAILVVLPRLCLAVLEEARVRLLRRRVSIAQDFYVRSLVRNALGKSRSIRVLPYGFSPADESRSALVQLLRGVFGDKTEVTVDQPVSYGEEDAWIARGGAALAVSDHLVLLFNLGSTPEAENHGAFVEGVTSQLGHQAEIIVLIDDSSFVHKLRGQPSADRRADERLQAWKAMLSGTGQRPIRISLASNVASNAAADLERELLRGRVDP
jgi:hypothetical protein